MARHSDPAPRRRLPPLIASLVIPLALLGSLATMARAQPAPLGELEEPGEVERIPPAESRKAPDPSEQALEAPPDEQGEEGEGRRAGSTAASAAEAESQPEEAVEILPDSEAIDETIEEPAQAPPDGEPAEAAKPEEPAPPPAEPQWTIRWQNAFILERVDDPRYQFLFGGRIQNDWGAYAPDSDLEDSVGGEGTGVEFRRARLYFQGQFFRYGFFKAEYDFSSSRSGPEFNDVYMGLSVPSVGLLRVGHFKEPFSLEFQNSSNFLTFNERSAPFAFVPGRNTGLMLNRNLLVRDATLSVAFFRRTDDVGEGFSNKEDYRLTSRLTYLPWFRDGGSQLLHLEVGYSHQFADPDEGTRFAQSAASAFSETLVDTGTLAVEDVDLLNVGLALVEGPFALQSEATLAAPHNGIDRDPIFWGFYAELSWWLTGENRRYLRGRGVFSRVVPRGRFDPEKGRWGAVELATRYAWLDLSSDGIRGGTLAEWSVALNWILFSNLRLRTDYTLSRAGHRKGVETGVAHSLVARFQVDF